MRLFALLAPLALSVAFASSVLAQEFSEPGLLTVAGRGEVSVAPILPSSIPASPPRALRRARRSTPTRRQ